MARKKEIRIKKYNWINFKSILIFPSGYHPSQPSLKREGVIFPPYEGGLKVGANFNFQVAPSGYHQSLYLSQNVTFSHLLFGRVSLGRKTIFLIRSIHHSLIQNDKDFSRFTSRFSLKFQPIVLAFLFQNQTMS